MLGNFPYYYCNSKCEFLCGGWGDGKKDTENRPPFEYGENDLMMNAPIGNGILFSI